MSIQLDTYGIKRDYQPCEPTAYEAAQGAALVNSAAWQEQLGADMYHTGNPITSCRSVAMRRGWERAAADDARAETHVKPWLADEPEDWAVELSAQIERNEQRIAANATMLAGWGAS